MRCDFFFSDPFLMTIGISGIETVCVKDRIEIELICFTAVPKYFGETVLLNQVSVQ